MKDETVFDGMPMDQSINAHHNTGTQSWVTFSLSKDSREKLMTFALIASALMLGWCWYTIDCYKAELRLKEYDLDEFQAEKFAPLQARVDWLFSNHCKE